jgi:hypothetical protein
MAKICLVVPLAAADWVLRRVVRVGVVGLVVAQIDARSEDHGEPELVSGPAEQFRIADPGVGIVQPGALLDRATSGSPPSRVLVRLLKVP